MKYRCKHNCCDVWMGEGTPRKVILNGSEYTSIKDLAIDLGMSPATVRERLVYGRCVLGDLQPKPFQFDPARQPSDRRIAEQTRTCNLFLVPKVLREFKEQV